MRADVDADHKRVSDAHSIDFGTGIVVERDSHGLDRQARLGLRPIVATTSFEHMS